MLAHCRTAGVPIGMMDQSILPTGPDWVHYLYAYADVYVKKIRQSLIKIQCWDLLSS